MNYFIKLITNKIFIIVINGILLFSLILNGVFIYLIEYSKTNIYFEFKGIIYKK